MKKSIVSVSRRTDIPAFFGDWFAQQLDKGHTTVYHPYKHERITVSLEPQDVAAFVFWSKDYRPFWNYLEVLDRQGYSFVFHYTITGLPSIFEPKVPSAAESCQTLKLISQRYSPQHITWRYDPIILTDKTPLIITSINFEISANNLKVIRGGAISVSSTSILRSCGH